MPEKKKSTRRLPIELNATININVGVDFNQKEVEKFVLSLKKGIEDFLKKVTDPKGIRKVIPDLRLPFISIRILPRKGKKKNGE